MNDVLLSKLHMQLGDELTFSRRWWVWLLGERLHTAPILSFHSQAENGR